jgi:WD40 repeat protein
MAEISPKLVRIFISSPRDVAEERRAAAELIEQELAKREAFRKPLKLDVFRYDDPHSDTPFLADRSPQKSVDQRLQSADAEIVVAILWARMGTPVPDSADPDKILYQSGTEQEIKEALKAGREVLVYFRRGQPAAPDDDDELDEFKAQRQKVREFRMRLENGGCGVNGYQDCEDFRRKLAQHLDQVLTRIRDASLAPARQVAIRLPLPWTGDPYPGLRSFEQEEAPIFFGRREETAELVRWVAEEGRRFVAVVGVSGSGKSSLVKAGLLPELGEWPSAIVRLIDAGGDPFRALSVRLGPHLPPSRRSEFRADPARRLGELTWIDEVLSEKPASTCLLIVIDQFEELQTAVPENWHEAFIGLLEKLAKHNRMRIVVSLRADFLGGLSRNETLAGLFSGRSFVLHPPGSGALRAIIRDPAKLVGVAVEDSLIDDLAEAARLELGALPLLAFTLERLYSRREGQKLVLPTVGGSTTLGAILGDYTNEVEEALPLEQREVFPQLFRHLVRVEDGGRRIAKRRCRPVDLGDDATIIALRDNLVGCRLLLALDDPADGVELAHEVLLQAWPNLHAWVAAFSTHLVVREDIERLRAAGAPRLEGWLLERAVDLVDRAPELLDEAQAALVKRSREEYEDFLRREANAVAERAAACIEEGDCATAIALCLEVLPTTPRSQRPATSLALSTLHEAWRSLRELRVVETEQDRVYDACFSPDGTRVVIAGEDGTVRLWHADGIGEPLILRGHEGPVRAASFSPDRTRLVSASEDGTVRLWYVDGASDPIILRGHKGRALTTSFSPDGTRVVSAGDDGMVLWQVEGTAPPLILGGQANATSFSPDGTLLVSGSDSGTVRVWHADGGGEPLTLRGHEGKVNATSFCPDGRRVVSASDDGTVRLWQADGAGEPLILRGHAGSVLAASFSPDSTRVVSAGDDGTLRLWQADRRDQALILRGVHWASFTSDGTRVVRAGNDRTERMSRADGSGELLIFGRHEGAVRAASFSPDGTRVVSAGDDGTMRLWSVDGTDEPLILPGDLFLQDHASFSPDGTRVVSADYDGILRLWRVDRAGEPLILGGHEGRVRAASFSSDGTRVVGAGNDRTVLVWRADGTGDPLILGRDEGGVRTASFSPDGTRVVSAGYDGILRLWRVDRAGELLTLHGHVGPVLVASFSPDSTRVVSTGDDGTVRLWRTEDISEPLILRGHEGAVRAASFSPDGRRVVSAGDDGTVRVWRTEGTSDPLILGGHDGEVSAASFSPNGTQVVSAGADCTVRLWQADGTGEPLVFRGHRRRVRAASFSPDGKRVVSVGDDATVQLWRADGSAPLILRGHRGGVRAASFSPDGTRVVTDGDDGTVRVWHVFANDHDLIEAARAILPRQLTDAQRARYHLPPRSV